MDGSEIDRIVAISRHERFRSLLDPASPDYDPLYERTAARFLPGLPTEVVPLKENLSLLAAARMCRWLDRKCGCQWGTCRNPVHERFGKEVGYSADCSSCGLMEVHDGEGSTGEGREGQGARGR